jgi:hypothetical protein
MVASTDSNQLFRPRRSLLVFACITGFVLTCNLGQAQTGAQASLGDQTRSAQPAANYAISGTVQDTNGGVIENATVQLSTTNSAESLRQVNSGAMGQFEFADLAPGTYIVKVSLGGMTTFVSKPIVVAPDKPVLISDVVLEVRTAATSVVVMDSEAASIEQVRIAERQRVFKVFPNFYSSYDWNGLAPIFETNG